MRKYLFVCAEGKSRSPTAARVAYEIAEENGKLIEMFYGAARAGSIDSVSRGCFDGYEKVFVMELWMASKMRRLGYCGKLHCLNIQDRYSRMDTELIDILRGKLEKLI